MKTDLRALFQPQKPRMSDGEAESFRQDLEKDLESMDCFILKKEKFVPLPKEEEGERMNLVFVLNSFYSQKRIG